jgi:hypothetical protein
LGKGRGRKDSSFSEEKEAKRLFIMAFGLALPAAVPAPRSASKSLFASFSSEKEES